MCSVSEDTNLHKHSYENLSYTVDRRDELLVHILDIIACIKESQGTLRRTTRHVLTRVAKCNDVDGGIFEYLL